MRLQCNPLALGTRKEITQPRDGRIAAVSADNDVRAESFPNEVDLPILSGGAVQSDHCCLFVNVSAERTRAVKKKMVEKTALDRDLAFVATRKIDPQFLAADGDKFHRVEHTV